MYGLTYSLYHPQGAKSTYEGFPVLFFHWWLQQVKPHAVSTFNLCIHITSLEAEHRQCYFQQGLYDEDVASLVWSLTGFIRGYKSCTSLNIQILVSSLVWGLTGFVNNYIRACYKCTCVTHRGVSRSCPFPSTVFKITLSVDCTKGKNNQYQLDLTITQQTLHVLIHYTSQ